ncbi:MAG: ABC transporter permease, partial [Ruminiclostridium sp.]
MREFLEVFKYTFKENVKKKSFIISTIIILVIVVGALLVPAIVTKVQSTESNRNPSEKSIVYLIDKSGYFEQNLQEVQKGFPENQIKLESEKNLEKIKGNIKEIGKSFLVVANLVNDVPKFEYYTKQYDDGPSAEIINKVFKNIYSSSILKQADISDKTISNVLSDLNININELGQNKWVGYFLSMIMSFLLFFAVYFYGYGVSMSVASEKTSRVMELLVTSVKPSRIILGKTAGMGVIGLMQFASIIIVGIVTYKLTFPKNFALDGINIDLSSFTPFSITMMIVYFILGYTLYALMNAVVG